MGLGDVYKRQAIVKVRRGNVWQDLIAPIPDARFWGVTIEGDRVIAVGEVGSDAAQRTPLAIVANTTGEGFVHDLPIRGTAGIARDVMTTSDGRVVAVGDESDGSIRRGAIWELLTADDLIEDRWTTRLSTELQNFSAEFIELWSLSEFELSLIHISEPTRPY